MLTPFATSAALIVLLVLVIGAGMWDDYRQMRKRCNWWGGP